MCHSFLPVFNSTSDVFCVLQKSYARQVKLSCQPYVYYICKQLPLALAVHEIYRDIFGPPMVRVAIDAAADIALFRSVFSSAYAKTIFDEWTYICTRFHSYSLSRAFSNQCVSVNTLSLSRTDTVISRSGLPHDASHLPSTYKSLIRGI